jgi:Autophagocytosis associated protein, active-site domain
VIDMQQLTGQPRDLQIQVIHIDFSITLSPTYSVPVLWFTSSALKSVNQIHEVLLPDYLDEAVRMVGVIGGLSQAVSIISATMSRLLTAVVSPNLGSASLLHSSVQYPRRNGQRERWQGFERRRVSSRLAWFDRVRRWPACTE